MVRAGKRHRGKGSHHKPEESYAQPACLLRCASAEKRALVAVGCMDIQYASPPISPLRPVPPVADSPSFDAAVDVHAYLAKLNDAQREAVEYGADDAARIAGALLVIAGAASGKTNTLAHRVAHLVLKGADPRRILLLTFSRCAAQEMTRRVTRIAGAALGARAAIAQALTWSGTFHSVGARLLREYADLIGLSPAYTINDREDSADLMNQI